MGKQSKNFFTKGFKQLKGILQVGAGGGGLITKQTEKTYEQEQDEQYRGNTTLIFNELSKFVQYFINYGLRYEVSHDLLL